MKVFSIIKWMLALYFLGNLLACRPTDKRAEADLEMRLIAFGVGAYDAEHVSGATNTNVMFGDGLYSNLVTMAKTRLLPERSRWDAGKRVIDPWGNDYRAERILRTNEHGMAFYEYRISTRGPNRRFEGDNGDDMFYLHKVPFN